MIAIYEKLHNWYAKNLTIRCICWLAIIVCFVLSALLQSWICFLISLMLCSFVMFDKWLYPKIKEFNALSSQSEIACQELRTLFVGQQFVEPMKGIHWRKKHAALIAQIAGWDSLLSFSNKAQDELLMWNRNFEKRAHDWNDQLAKILAPEVSRRIGEVEGYQLDEQQLGCIAKDVHNSLVIAGAGTGKTTTVIGKIKYLLSTGKYTPEDFLVLSYTNASASEMSERIAKETGEYIEASTFHKLGLNIITAVDGIKPKIADIQMRPFIKGTISENMTKPAYATLMTSYLLFHHVGEESEWVFHTEEEYHQYLRFNPPCTMKAETVKSYGEVDIANFLYMNQIEYVYEKPYPMDTRTAEYGEYKPDFYLPEYDVYIEYFGIAADGNVPEWFSEKHGMSAKDAYHQSMQWKRNLHAQHGTKLIECYAWERFDGVLIDELQRKLEEADVSLAPQSAESIWDKMTEENEAVIDGILQLFATVISLMKSNRYTIEDVRQLANKHRRRKDINVLLKLVEPIATKYNEVLTTSGAIDFSDMINQATDYVSAGKYHSSYKYVIVDEYQDISKERFMLLKALRKSRFYDLFCVGDDWQSIYRFTGSDIDFILQFEKYWGPAETSKIETTYRFSQELSEISGQFVMKNPAQVRKSIKGLVSQEGKVVEEIYGTCTNNLRQNIYQVLQSLPRNSTVYFIGRYNSDIKMFEDDAKIDYSYNNAEGEVRVFFKDRKDLKITFMSAHKSKGLQADYVFIINNKNARMGFPSRIQDAPILHLLLGAMDDYPFAEERRLYYVALTRARRKVFLCTLRRQESMFVFDVLKQPLCPKCGGRMFIRHGQWGDFWGCENYSSGMCKHTKKIKE